MGTNPDNIQTCAPQATCVCAIDIGSNEIRAAIAEVTPSGDIELLEHLSRSVRLGQDTFRRGSLSESAIRAAVEIIRDFRKKLDFYGVVRTRATATSAVREATNGDNLLDRILMATGVEVEVINTAEESRLTVWAVRQGLGKMLAGRKTRVLIVNVGGGSTLLTRMKGNEIIASSSLPLGSIRLQEHLSTTQESPAIAAKMLRGQLDKVIATSENFLPLRKIRKVIAIGGDARFAAKQIGSPTAVGGLLAVVNDDFNAFIERCERYTAEAIAQRHHLKFSDAETMNPALLILQGVLRATAAEEFLVSKVSMRDGLLMDLARTVTGSEDPALFEGAIRSAWSIAEKYHVDLEHARRVVTTSLLFFDELQDEYGLSSRYRLLLEVAAILHEVGGFVANRAHHKHSMYLIKNSEIFGFSREEIGMVAHIARYHRRNPPKATHVEYMQLPRDQRMVISKLAAILRVADALDRAHVQRFGEFHIQRRERELVLTVAQLDDLTLERKTLAKKVDLFNDMYGLSIRLVEGR